MSNAKTTQSEVIAAYKRGTAMRRSKSRLNQTSSEKNAGVSVLSSVVTVSKASNTKPVSELGGPTKVFGHSKIWIPEYRRTRS